MAITAADVKSLRERTQAGMLDCKKALVASDGDIEKAIEWLREKGLSKVAKKAGRDANEGVISSYVHQGSRVGVMVEVNCETDFVARSEDFQAFVHDLMLHITMADPLYMNVEDIPAEDLDREKERFKKMAMDEGKPEHIAEKIVTGRLEKFYSETVLMKQAFIKDEDMTVLDLLNATISKIGENMIIQRFTRYELGR